MHNKSKEKCPTLVAMVMIMAILALSAACVDEGSGESASEGLMSVSDLSAGDDPYDIICYPSCEYKCPSCGVDITKKVALDDDCNGVADGYFEESVAQDDGECVVYQICVINKGYQPLCGVIVKDDALAITDLEFDTLGPFDRECKIIPQEAYTPFCIYRDESYRYPYCYCDAVAGVNTARIASATCGYTCQPACYEPYSDCEDSAEVTCLGPALTEGCLTRTPGYWSTHPNVTSHFLPVTSCGLEIDTVDMMVQDLCISNVDAQGNSTSMEQLQLIRQCTAAQINLGATGYNGASCELTLEEGIEDRIAYCCDEICPAALSGQDIGRTGCIEDIDDFNNSSSEGLDEMELCPNADLGTTEPCKAWPAACNGANGDGVVNPGRPLGLGR